MASTLKKRQLWDKDSMAKAILAVQEKRMGYLKASKTFNVPKTTLIRLNKQKKSLIEVTNLKLGRNSTLSVELEKDLAEYLLQMERSGFGLTRRDIRTLAYQLAEKNNLAHTFSKEKESAGKTWLRLFLQRHPDLSFRRPTGTSISRMKGFNKESVDVFFTLLEDAIDKKQYSPNNIYNVDETGITVVPSKMPEVLTQKGKRQVNTAVSAERGSTVTCVMCMNAAGSFVPPVMIFPRKRDHPNLMKGAPLGAIHFCHPSGWMQTDIFTKWFKHFLHYAKPSAHSPVLLILDGHASHTRNIELIDLARSNNVQILSLPAHSSHKMQPLDHTFMGPFKKYFTEEVRQWVRNKNKAATHYDIAEIFGRAYIKSQRAELAINGFRVTGIYPVDRTVFQDHDFLDDEVQPTNSEIQNQPAFLVNTTQNRQIDGDIIEAPDFQDNQIDLRDFEVEDQPSVQMNIIPLAQDNKNNEYSDSDLQNKLQTAKKVPSLVTQSLLSLVQNTTNFRTSEKPTTKPSDVKDDNDHIPPLISSPKNPALTSDVIAGPSTSAISTYVSSKQLLPLPQLKKSSHRVRKGTKPTVLTSSPYKAELELSLKKKEVVEKLKENRNISKKVENARKLLRENTVGAKSTKEIPKATVEHKKKLSKQKMPKQINKKEELEIQTEKNKKKREYKQNKKSKKKLPQKKKNTVKPQSSDSSSEDLDTISPIILNDDTDESPDRTQSDNAKCFYCNGLYSEDTQGEQWIECSYCKHWVHEECAGVEGFHYVCEFCNRD